MFKVQNLNLENRFFNLYKKTDNPTIHAILDKHLKWISQGKTIFQVSENLVNDLCAYGFIESIKSELNSIIEDCNKNWIYFQAIKTSDNLKSTKKNLELEVAKKLDTIIESSKQIYKDIIYEMDMYKFIPDVLKLINTAVSISAEKPINDNLIVTKVYSPVWSISESKKIFNIMGQDYVIDVNVQKTEPVKLKDRTGLELYDYLLESLKFFRINEAGSIVYDTPTSKIIISESGEISVDGHVYEGVKDKSSLKRFFEYGGLTTNVNATYIPRLLDIYENLDIINEIDVAKDLQVKGDASKRCIIVSSGGNHCAHLINLFEKSHKFIEFEDSQSFVETINRFLNVDISSWISGSKDNDKRIKADIKKQNAELFENIKFLDSQIRKITSNSNFEYSKELQDLVLELHIEKENLFGKINSNSKSINESEEDKMSDLGYVLGSALMSDSQVKRGESLWVSADEYLSAGDNELIDCILYKTNKHLKLPKRSLDVKII